MEFATLNYFVVGKINYDLFTNLDNCMGHESYLLHPNQIAVDGLYLKFTKTLAVYMTKQPYDNFIINISFQIFYSNENSVITTSWFCDFINK